MTAIYHNGYPQNFAAAALDALDWMRVFHGYMISRQIVNQKGETLNSAFSAENIANLKRAITVLEKFISDKPPIFAKDVFVDGYQIEPKPYPAQEIEATVDTDRQCAVCEALLPDKEKHPSILCGKPECSEAWQRLHQYKFRVKL